MRPLKPVTRKDDSFKDFVLDQLSDLQDLSCRGMFGGYGLYQRSVFFGIIHGGRLYFKTNDRTRAMYIHKGMKPLRPNAKQTLKHYYAVPVEIIEDEEQLADWARQAALVQ